MNILLVQSRSKERDRHRRAIMAVYGQPTVREACIDLQDSADIDVILLLHVLYLAAFEKRSPSLAYLKRLDAGLAPWREQIVKPLRQARRALKNRSNSTSTRKLYDRAKAAELAAEMIALDDVYALRMRHGEDLIGDGGATAASALSSYYRISEARITALVVAAATAGDMASGRPADGDPR